MDLALFLIFLGSFCVYVYRERQWRFSVLDRCGIPGPAPNLIWGNLWEYYGTENVLWDSALVNNYGPIAGYYLGAKPIVVVTDPALLELIHEKDGKQWLERPRRVPGGINPDPHRALMLGNLPVLEWKKMRAVLSPSFSAGQLKGMSPAISELIDRMISGLTRNEDQNLYEKFQAMTLDIIGASAFGLHSNILENPNDPLLQAVAAEFSKHTNSVLINIYLCFPEIAAILSPIRRWVQKLKCAAGLCPSSPLWDAGREALKKRLNEGKLGTDLLQRLIEARLPPNQIVANTVLFFEAAYETLSSSLGFMTHLLVNHPDVQRRLKDEVTAYLEKHEDLDYGVLNGLKYMDAVITEALRLFPPQTTFIDRAPAQDFEYRKETADGSRKLYKFPKGIHTQVGLFQIHHSDFWANPENFDPDRFFGKPEAVKTPMYEAFGAGQRKCIGERFAKLVIKMTLAKLLNTYELIPCERTEGKVAIQYKVATMTPKYGSWLTPASA